ncbi:MAG: sodium:solute symporter family transporter [Christensenellales bacterium]
MQLSWVFLGIYALLLISVAVYSSRRVKSMDDFFLGGRSLGGWMSAFSYGTSYFSAVVFIGYAGQFGWQFGISSTWIGIGNAIIGSLLAWIVLAKRTRRMTQQLGASTMPDFFEKRYRSKGLKLMASVLIFVFLVPYSASVYQGLSTLFESLLNVPYIICMVAMVIISASYLIAGGYKATALTDFIQGCIMLVGIIIVVALVLVDPTVGGLTEGMRRLSAIDPAYGAVFGSSENLFSLISVFVLTSLGTWGLPQMVHKFYAIRDEKAILRGTVISTVFATIVAGGSYFIGGFGHLFVAPEDMTSTSQIMPRLLQSIIPSGIWGSALIGVILVLVLSASLSTLTSLVLVSSSSISMDLVGGLFFKNIKPKAQNILMRLMCGVFIALSFFLDLNKVQGIVKLMSLSWGCLAGAFLGPFLMGLYWKGTTKDGAWIGMIGGLAICLGLNLLPLGISWLNSLSSGAIAMVSSVLLTFLGSLFTKKLPAEHVQQIMFRVKNESVAMKQEQ